MSEKDIFNRQPINPEEFEGEDVDAMRAHLKGGVQMTGAVPPQVQASMNQPQFANHPLKDDFQMPQAMTEAQMMHQNARKLMRAPEEQEQQQFNPNFSPQQAMQQAKYGDFKDSNYERVMKGLMEKTGNYEQIELPSRGKFYLRGEGPSNGILHIRPMTGNEEQILFNPRHVKQNRAINMIFKECIGEQINPELLLSEDRNFILIYLRGISHSPIYTVEITCPGCTKSFQNNIHLNALDVDFCPEDFGPEDLNDVLPNSGLKIHYRFSVGKDDTIVQEHKDKRVKDWGSEVADDSNLFRISLLIEDIEGINNKLMLQQVITRLPLGDMGYLRELLNEPPFGVNSKVGVICPHCAHEFEIDMPMEFGFFFPKPNLQRKKKQPA